jgi:hypothetical protein
MSFFYFSSLLVTASSRLASRSRSTDLTRSCAQQLQEEEEGTGSRSLDMLKTSLRQSHLLLQSVRQVRERDTDSLVLCCGSRTGKKIPDLDPGSSGYEMNFK